MKKGAWINGLIVVIAVSAGLALSRKPWQVYQEQRKAADEQIAEMEKSEATREALVRQDAKLKSSVGREELVRDAGYRKPGERPLK
ncbi:MAG: hypothetical protein ACAH95_15085 [Fimbriimonas sp.]